MIERWRLLDTGLASAGRNIALNRALLEARHANESPSTLRFFRFAPCALLGSRQSAREELDGGYCAAQAVPIQRRITGGTTWFVDERQLGWELYVHRREVGDGGMPALMKRIGHAAATALSALGVDARFRARDEIEVEGRVICTLAHAAEGGGALCQALLLVDPDLERAVRVLRLPGSREFQQTEARAEELPRASAALALRVGGLKQVLGRVPHLKDVRRKLAEAFESEFDVEFSEGDLNLSEHDRYLRAAREIESAGWVDLISSPASGMRLLEAAHLFEGGVLRVHLKYEVATRTIRQVWFSGDIAWNPRRTLLDFEAALRDVPIDRLEREVRLFFASRAMDRAAPDARDLIDGIRRTAQQPLTA